MKIHHLFLCVAFLVINSCSSLRTSLKSDASLQDFSDLRLSNNVIPQSYDLSLWVDPQKEFFSGRATITVEIKVPQPNIILHAQDLKVNAVQLEGQHGFKMGSYRALEKNDLAALNFGSIIDKGHYKIIIDYSGIYQKDLSGLYRVKDGEEFYLYSQLEPLSARKIMPCFDEPRFKTPFEMSIISPKNLVVISNAPEISARHVGDNTIHVFAKTKPLPTYLLALAVGPFDIVLGEKIGLAHNVAFRGISTKGKGDKLTFAMKETPQILAKLEEYFGRPYPFAKLDILAVPDFSAGAMENVGAITFREWYLLLNKNSSSEQQQKFYEIMAHELAHQWFGNLVTMPWWDDLWLNEAFATWLSYKIVDHIRPDYKGQEKVLGRSHRAMAEDSLIAARKIREPIASSHDIHNAFDGITYGKGAAVLSMLENFLGADHFRKAVSSYITRFSDGHATSKDFLSSLAQFSEAKLVKSADSFLNQNGVPLVELAYACTASRTQIRLTQKRYAPVGSKANLAQTWEIPMCIGYEQEGELKKHCFWLDKVHTKIVLKTDTCPAFIMPNYNGQGYYRFSLKHQDWSNLLKYKNMLSEADRISLADSMLAELDRNNMDFGLVADSLASLSGINSSLSTKYFMNLIENAHTHWVHENHQSELVNYASQTLRPIYEELTALKNPSFDQQNLKADISQFLAINLGDKEARKELSTLGKDYLQNIIKPDTRSLSFDENLVKNALGIALQSLDDQRIDTVIGMLGNEHDSVVRTNILTGLAHARSGEGADRIRKLVFNNNLRKNEQFTLLMNHLENTKNQPMTWKFLSTNLEALQTALPNTQLSRLPFLAHGLCSEQSVSEVRTLLEPLVSKYEGGPRNLAASLEQIEICTNKRQHTSKMANNFFENKPKELQHSRIP